jgi:chorismate dehydratase
VKDSIELVVDYPSHIANGLINDDIDIGLVPVAIIPELPESHILTDYCIGCDGPVDSVAIFSELPLEQVNTVMLDYQSRTSVMLTRILMQDYWKKQVRWINTKGEAYRQAIRGDVAGMVIGDRALAQKKVSTYMYDLGAAWKAHTGLPFVFAAWVSNKELSPEFISQFNEANAIGLQQLDAVVEMENYDHGALRKYYTENISYLLTTEKRKGLASFLLMMKAFNTINAPLSPSSNSL